MRNDFAIETAATVYKRDLVNLAETKHAERSAKSKLDEAQQAAVNATNQLRNSLRSLRLACNVSTRQIASDCGFNPYAIEAFEQGLHVEFDGLSEPELIRITDYLLQATSR